MLAAVERLAGDRRVGHLFELARALLPPLLMYTVEVLHHDVLAAADVGPLTV